ncbi:MFS transporter [Paenibacillus cisolokensis]|uniref:MFS transporter n=1 Tax=Paenibacillus campinasensis TaxID=66347 RepID=A0ABW9T0I0_9BACL|nr:MFS transporter [Paenibacillus campinasensis]MUG66614.1 MFS transporter [Paenibacillus campinasensis]
MVSSSTRESNPRSSNTVSTGLLFAGMILVAINLRAAITSVGPLIGMIREGVGISNTMAGMLTTIPLLAFALLSPIIPSIGRKLGLEATLLLSLVVLTLGIGMRSIASPITLLLGTALLGSAIAAGNVLLPSLVKRDFPHRIGLMTGAYSASINLMAAVASGVSIPIAVQLGFGWQGSLGIWSLLSVGAAVLWFQQWRNRPATKAVSVANAPGKQALFRSKTAWCITLFMGMQSFTFYVNISWLPEILQSQGIPAVTAGWMLSIMQFVSIPFSFIIPILAGRNPDQRTLLAVSLVSMFIGYGGLLIGWTSLTWFWVILVGIAGGANFSLSLIFFTLRTRTAQGAAAMSGMAQSIGYLLAAVGPMLIGLLHDMTSGWSLPLMMLMAVTSLSLVVGLGAAKPGYVSDN